MKIGKACAIFMQIDSDKYTVEEKGTAIYEVLQMPTHNGITKGNMLSVINFLLRLAFDVPEKPAKVCAGGCVRSYADPPYTPETRRKNIYAEEMTVEQHVQMLEALKAHGGSVVLSGYENELYNDMLQGWRRVEKHALAERGQTRTEIVWIKDGNSCLF